MGMFLNSNVPFEAYSEIVSDIYFVDKSMLIEELLPAIGKTNRYICITRPRRFGKSVMAAMVGAFLEKVWTAAGCRRTAAVISLISPASWMA